jgi:hypothetical protein
MTQDLSPEEWELAREKLDNDIRRLIGLYGRDEVRAATAKLTKKRTGPTELKYWHRIHKLFEEDAIRILNCKGEIDFTIDEYYRNTIQDLYHPDDSEAARSGASRHLKLKKWWTLIFAVINGSAGQYSHMRYREVLVALRRLDHLNDKARAWDEMLASVDRARTEYVQRFGALPADELSLTQLREAQPAPTSAGSIDEPGPLSLLSDELQAAKQAHSDEFMPKNRPTSRDS